jgi:multidrug efflux pump subunit AcrA (membrane-fusion protein)
MTPSGRRTKTTIAASILLAIVIGVGALWFTRSPSKNTAEVKRGDLVEGVYGIGTVTSRRVFRGRVGSANGISETLTHEGDLVAKGQVLIRLQDGLSIRAPFSGTVTSLPYYSGETVLPDAQLVVVEDLTDRYVVATLEQQGALRVRPRMPVKLSFESLREQTLSGQVRSIYPQKSQFMVEISVENLPSQILPAMTADVAIQVAERKNALLVPERAVNQGQVVVAGPGGKRKVEVKIGLSDGQLAEVLEGDLKEGDRVLLPGG